jgi:hypothetical protein
MGNRSRNFRPRLRPRLILETENPVSLRPLPPAPAAPPRRRRPEVATTTGATAGHHRPPPAPPRRAGAGPGQVGP